ncbi:MAG: hypothetical protein NT149_01835 [Candidatus Gottesmanbacteria bacterium]|nr:hypothetical protein [Candidatus Gottesmanbacteria bacterium]
MMSKSERSLLKSFVVFVFLVAISVVAAIWYQQRTATPAEASAGQLPETSVNSSNADKKLIFRVTPQPGGMTEYSYIVADVSGRNPRMVFDKTLPAGASMLLPDNSWDPTDTYVFLEELNSGAVDFFVVKVNGEPFADGNKYIDVGAVWANKKIGYTIRTATGWASGTLLIIYTSKDDGSRGPAYWFEIPSTAILQLAG